MSDDKNTPKSSMKAYYGTLIAISVVLAIIAIGIQYLYATNVISPQPASALLFFGVFSGFLFFIMTLSHPKLSFLNKWK